MVCANCGCRIDPFRDSVVYDPVVTMGFNEKYCSKRCQREYHQTHENPADAFVRQMREQEQARRQAQERARRQAEEEARRQAEEAEKARLEKLGTCAWCGKQNEQVYANQLLFPGKKFCSKKCLFDCKSAENPPEAADTPYITSQNTGNVFTSFADAVEYAQDGDTLLLTKGIFETSPVDIIISKSLILKGANTASGGADEEKTVFKFNQCNILLEPRNLNDKIVIDGIIFNNSSNFSFAVDHTKRFDKSNGGAPGDCITIKNSTFRGFTATVFYNWVDNLTVENCLFENCQQVFLSCGLGVDDTSVKNCTFNNVEEIFAPWLNKGLFEENTLNNSFMSQFHDVPAGNPKTTNERTKKVYVCLQEALDEAVAGDTLSLSPGVFNKGFVLSNKRNLTIKAASDTDRVVFNLPRPDKSLRGRNIHFYGDDTDSIEIKGLFFNFFQDAADQNGFYLTDTINFSTITFSNCIFNNVIREGFKAFTLKKCKFNKNAVRSVSAICKNCGDTLFEGKKFCTHCGAKIES